MAEERKDNGRRRRNIELKEGEGVVNASRNFVIENEEERRRERVRETRRRRIEERGQEIALEGDEGDPHEEVRRPRQRGNPAMQANFFEDVLEAGRMIDNIPRELPEGFFEDVLEGGRIINDDEDRQLPNDFFDDVLAGGRLIDQYRTENRYYNELLDRAHEQGLRVYLENFGRHYGEGVDANMILARFLRWQRNLDVEEDGFKLKSIDVLNFFVSINDGLEMTRFSQNRHRSGLKTTLKQWVAELEKYVRRKVLRREFDESFHTRFISAPGFLINRLTIQEINWAIEYAITVVQRTLQTEEQKDAVATLINEVCITPYFTPPSMPRDLDRDDERYLLARRLSNLTQERLDNIWKVLLSIFHIMHRVVSSRLSVTDVLLAQENYRRTSEFDHFLDGVGELRATQAFPFILFESENHDINLLDELLIPDLFKKYLQTTPLRQQHLVDDIWIKVKVKIIFTQNTPEGQENETRYWIINLNLVNVLPPRDYARDELTGEIPGGVVDLSDGEKEELWTMLEDEEQFKEAFMELLTNQLKEAPEHYKEKYEFLDDEKTQVDLRSIGIGYTMLGVKLKRRLNGESFSLDPNSTILKPAFCQTASEGLIKKCASYSEVTNYGICLFEAYWTARHYEDIASHKSLMSSKGLKKLYVKEDRKVLILEAFMKVELELQEIVFKGDTANFTEYVHKRGFQVFFWDGAPENLDPAFIVPMERLSILRPTILIFSSHAICATTCKLKQEFKKKCCKATEERTKSFICRPLEILKEEPQEENWCLDIECSIDKKTGIFEPYFIGIILHEKGLKPTKWNPLSKNFEVDTTSPTRYMWWGAKCKEDLMRWMKSKVDGDLGNIAHQKKPNKISLWGYNILRFDCIFFLVDMLKEFVEHGEVDIKGSVENPKSVILNKRLTIRDLLKIVPGMSLAKAGEFWSTVKRKTHVNHDEITHELIAKIYKLEEDPYAMVLEEDMEENERLMKLKDDLIEYCMNDIEVTIECIEKYMNWVWAKFKVSPYVISTASLSLSIWMTHYHPAINKEDRKKNFHYKNPIGMSRDKYDKVRKSYKGGLVLVPKQINDIKALAPSVEEALPGRPVFVYDINSHYPARMMEKLPYKYLKTREYGHGWRDLTQLLTSEIINTNLYGIKGLKWKSDTYMPTIPKRTLHGLNNTLEHDYLDYIWGVEVKHAMSTGEIEEGFIFEEMVFEADYVYREFVEVLHGMRLDFQNQGDKSGEKLVKLILNSLYGKAAQKNYPTKKIVGNNALRYFADQIIEPPLEICPGIWSITIDPLAECASFHISHDVNEKHPHISERRHIGTLVHLAAYITASARVVLLQFCKEIGWENVLYTDTDSVTTFISFRENLGRNIYKKLPEYSESEIGHLAFIRDNYIDDKKLGYFKEEKNEDDVIMFRFMAVAKKMYLLQGIDRNGKIITYIKSKGLTTGNMTLEDFLELKTTGKLINKKGGTKWNRHKGFVQIKDNIKSLNVTNFRTYINNGLDSIPFHT